MATKTQFNLKLNERQLSYLLEVLTGCLSDSAKDIDRSTSLTKTDIWNLCNQLQNYAGDLSNNFHELDGIKEKMRC